MGQKSSNRSSQRHYEGRVATNRFRDEDDDSQGSQRLNLRRLKCTPVTLRANQKHVLHLLSRHSLTFLIGPAGTGKTFLPVLHAVEKLKSGEIKKIVAVRPAVEAGDSIGYLTGGLSEKMAPYLRPVLDAFEKILGKPQLDALMREGVIEITSLTYLRGRTIEDAVYIMDEMQNATPAQLKMALTRIGENCTAIVTMDPHQCDINFSDSCILDLSRFENNNSIAVFRFAVHDVVRSEIVKTILQVYNT